MSQPLHNAMVGPTADFDWERVAILLLRRGTASEARGLEITLPEHLNSSSEKKHSLMVGRHFGWYFHFVGLAYLSDKWCSRFVTLSVKRSSTVMKLRTLPSIRASRKASLYWGRPTSSNQRTTHWWSRRPGRSLLVAESCLAWRASRIFFLQSLVMITTYYRGISKGVEISTYLCKLLLIPSLASKSWLLMASKCSPSFICLLTSELYM